MQRILILGCSGSGKTTLGRRLADALDLPAIHMDQHYFYPNWVEKSAGEWSQYVADMVGEDQWVMDGNYSRTLEPRLARADTAIFIDLPTWFCLYRVLRRTLTAYGKVRPGSSPGCPERFDWNFLGYILNYNKTRRPKILKKMNEFSGKTNILRSVKEIDNFVTQIIKK